MEVLKNRTEQFFISDTVQATIFSVLIVLSQMMNVAQVGVIGPSLFGTVSHGIWISTIELQLMVMLQSILGPFAALGIIATSFGFSLIVTDPAFIGPTIWSKVFALGAASLVFWLGKRYKWGTLAKINLAFISAQMIDVLAFALLAGLPEIITSSLIIRIVLHAMTMAIIYGVAYHRKKEIAV